MCVRVFSIFIITAVVAATRYVLHARVRLRVCFASAAAAAAMTTHGGGTSATAAFGVRLHARDNVFARLAEDVVINPSRNCRNSRPF